MARLASALGLRSAWNQHNSCPAETLWPFTDMVPVAVVWMEAELTAEMTVHPLTFSQISWIERFPQWKLELLVARGYLWVVISLFLEKTP